MNKLHITGNLTRDPELRTTSTGVNVCDFTVAVNKRGKKDQNNQNNQPEADFFRVTAWRELGENCAKYLAKGRKVLVVGSVTGRMYTGNDGVQRMSLEVTADEVEFLSPNPNGQQGQAQPAPAYPGAQPAYPNPGYPNAAYVPQAPQGYAPPPQGYAYPQQAPAPQAPAPGYQQQQMPIAGAPAGSVPPGFTEVNTDDLPF